MSVAVVRCAAPTSCARFFFYPLGSPGADVHRDMLTMHLSLTETVNYAGHVRAEARRCAANLARRRGARFAQIVASDGRIVDVLEVV